MSDGSPRGFLLSATLHGGVALLVFLTYLIRPSEDEQAKVFELVAGEGDNYMASEAPALGTPDGVKLNLPKAPQPRPPTPEPPREEVVPAPPTPKATTNPVQLTEPEPAPNFRKKIQRAVIVAESQAKRDIKRQREAEAKREREAEAKRAAEEKKRLTKEEFDRANKAKSSSTAAKSAPVKVAKIDAEGIAKGVVGGSTSNKVGGAGGKAGKSDNVDVLAGYDALFKQRLRAEFEPPPGLSDSLKVEVEVRSHVDGSLSGARIARSSGSPEFDRAVLEALSRVRMPARPDKKTEFIAFTFTMRERE